MSAGPLSRPDQLPGHLPGQLLGATPSRLHPRGMEPLTRLFETPPLPGSDLRAGLPADLARAYAGELAIPLRKDRPTVIANFVQTIDGAVALDREGRTGGGEISGFSPTDRFVMGLLRAMADVVLVGAGTARASEGTGWTAGRVFPPAAAAYADLRRRLGLAPAPTAVIVTAGGHLDPAHPAFRDPDVPVVLAGPPAAIDRLRAMALPPHVRIETLGDGTTVPTASLIGLADRLGARLVLSEGGPHLIGAFVAAQALDELFLTVSPQLVGRTARSDRLSLVEGIALPAERAPWAELLSVRLGGHHLFLRYRFEEVVR